MVAYNEREQTIIDHFADFKPERNSSRTKYELYMDNIPNSFKRYKCHTCYKILDNEDLVDGKCPNCGEPKLQTMCILDHNGCKHDIVEQIVYCPVCQQPVCPECGDHSVVVISRVTGYLSDVAGWNNAKKAELKDRVRVNLNQSNDMIRVLQSS